MFDGRGNQESSQIPGKGDLIELLCPPKQGSRYRIIE
jgi:hypothetical protein